MTRWPRALFLALSVAACLLLAACAQPSAPAPQSMHSGADLVAAIRSAGGRDASIIQVHPLRKPGVKRLLAQAHRQESAHQFKQAAATLDQALRISPEAPDLLQDRAELAVRLGDYAQAEKLARHSYRAGPKLGSLCARNWQTVVEMRRIAKDAAGMQAARKELARCEESGPVRM